MPIVQDPEKSLPLVSKIWPENLQSRIQKLPDEIKKPTSFLDGPVDVPKWIPTLEAKAEAMVQIGGEARTSDRQELMERIKRGESPTWVPRHAVRIRTRVNHLGHLDYLGFTAIPPPWISGLHFAFRHLVAAASESLSGIINEHWGCSGTKRSQLSPFWQW